MTHNRLILVSTVGVSLLAVKGGRPSLVLNSRYKLNRDRLAAFRGRDNLTQGGKPMQFADRTVIVTGGGSGIGQAMAIRFAAERAAVVIADREGGRAMEVARKITAAGGKAIATQTDVSLSPDVQAMVALAVKSFGAVDVLVNNAAAPGGDNVASMDEATWDRDLTVCLKSAFLCCRYVLPAMIDRRRGVIVNIASVNALGFFGNEAYSAAKAGVINLTESLAARYGRFGIRANAIAPGSIRTPIWQHRIDQDPEVLKRPGKMVPVGPNWRARRRGQRGTVSGFRRSGLDFGRGVARRWRPDGRKSPDGGRSPGGVARTGQVQCDSPLLRKGEKARGLGGCPTGSYF